MENILVGISSCLLGENVRYDGGHKLDHYLKDTLGRFVEWVPVCPEVECGLSIPREAMHLAGDPRAPRLVTIRTSIDHTERMRSWAESRIKRLEDAALSGFIFKSKSPSSGLRNVKVYNAEGMPGQVGVGIFAGMVQKRFPLMPMEEDGRLNDPGIRENFIERVFVYYRWQKLLREEKGVKAFVDFHTDHKLLIMAHSPQALSRLGRLVAGTEKKKYASVLEEYGRSLMNALALEATVKKNVNVLQHCLGYFKERLSSDEKQEALAVIEQYHQNLVPLIVPIVLVRHYVRKYQEPYLLRQWYLYPHPIELMLRNHV